MTTGSNRLKYEIKHLAVRSILLFYHYSRRQLMMRCTCRLFICFWLHLHRLTLHIIVRRNVDAVARGQSCLQKLGLLSHGKLTEFWIEKIYGRFIVFQLVVEANVNILLINGRQNLKRLLAVHHAYVALVIQFLRHSLKMLPLRYKCWSGAQELLD